MATQLDDYIVLQNGSVSGAGGNDTYILSGSLVQSNASIQILDTEGTNRLQLIDGLSITSSKVASTGAILNLSNGAEVRLLGADNFQYEVGGNPLSGSAGSVKNFSAFASETLGVNVPAAGQPVVTGAAKAINTGTSGGGNNGGGQKTIVDVDKTGSSSSANGAFVFNFGVKQGQSYNYSIAGFGTDDEINFAAGTNTPSIKNNSASDGTIVITGVNTANAAVVEITLTGIPQNLDGQVFNTASFREAFGADSLDVL